MKIKQLANGTRRYHNLFVYADQLLGEQITTQPSDWVEQILISLGYELPGASFVRVKDGNSGIPGVSAEVIHYENRLVLLLSREPSGQRFAIMLEASREVPGLARVVGVTTPTFVPAK